MEKMDLKKSTYQITDSACDQIADAIMEFCSLQKISHRDALRYRLSAEECLIYWQKNGFEGNAVHLHMGHRMLSPVIILDVEGKALDPYRSEREDFGLYCGSVLTNLRLAPEYSYENGHNRLLFRMQRAKPGQVVRLAFVIVFAVLVGSLGLILLPDWLRMILQNEIITPIYNTFFNILSCIAGPMIFLAVTWGIYGIGDAATLGRVGKRLIQRCIGMVFLAAACCTVLFPLFGNSLKETEGLSGQGGAIFELILGIFPSTIIEPFATGNTLQIIFFAIVIGVAMLFLGNKTSAVARAIEQVNYLVQFLMDLISRLVPFVIFLVIINLIWSGNLDALGSLWQLLLIFVLVLIAAGTVFLMSVALLHKVSPLVLLRKSMGTFIIALATASSAAAFASNMSTCEKKYGISTSLCGFGIPLGMVMHRPIAAIYNLLLTFYFAAYYNVSCSVSWIVLAVIVSCLLAIATPPIPGGGAIAYAIMFAQLGIPDEAITIAFTIDILTDFAITAFEMFCMQFSLIHSARKFNMIDLDILRAE
jgi:Na+/H+-dicarboxylate symporter